jgi:hypothetical protein
MGLENVGWIGPWIESASGCGHVVGCCECGNEPSGSRKCGEFVG